MKMIEMRNELIKQMNDNEFPNDAIKFLSNDVPTLLFIEHVFYTEKMTINEMFDDAGFVEFLHSQFVCPLSIDEILSI